MMLPALGVLFAARAAEPRVDADFPGGNIVVERFTDGVFDLRQDQRDTREPWFYWHFRVREAEGERLRFRFTAGRVLGPRGPAVSRDAGHTWQWLPDFADAEGFEFAFGRDDADVHFCFGIPYLESHWRKFLAARSGQPGVAADVLCRTKKSREVERLRLGRLDGQAEHRVLLTARHHACEMSANYALEGTIDAVLAADNAGRWLREHVEFLVIPFIDKDGVEEGDQGKLRQPHDPWLDYAADSIYPAPAALRARTPEWSQGKLRLALDFHSPARLDRKIYFAAASRESEPELLRFCRALQTGQRGPLPYNQADNLPFGTSWNAPRTYGALRGVSQWSESLPGARFAATLELPYAQVGDEEVTPEALRRFGGDVAGAIAEYLQAVGQGSP